jgi:beta-N-acetylhexosaminidase
MIGRLLIFEQVYITLRNVKLFLSAALFMAAAQATFAQQQSSFISTLSEQNHWVDSVFSKLNRKQKVAQLFFIRAHTNKGKAYADSVAGVIKHEQPGGLVFFQGGPVRQAALSNQYQQLAHIPLLIAMDGEWGLGMRLDSTLSYPYQMTLGAIQDDQLLNQMGQQVAYDFKRLGMHLNFAPVVDINNNPGNPVINYRSFGDNKYKVALKSIAYMQGMQQGGLLTTAKHFPGHGDTNVDSHYDLPQLNFTRTRLDTLEEYPFKQAIQAGISGVMVAHMSIPALDTTKNLPSSLSKPIITGLLKDSLGFKGLVVSDAMEMKGVVKFFPNGEADLKAFMAGNDILELSENSMRAIKMIKRSIRKGLINEAELDTKVKKVLAAKYWVGLNHYQPTYLQNIPENLNREPAKALIQELSDAAITLLQDNGLIQRLNFEQKTALVSIGTATNTTFQLELAKTFANKTLFNIDKNASGNDVTRLLNELKTYGQIMVGVHDMRLRPQSKLDYSDAVKNLIAQLANSPNAAISLFANPYTIATLPGIEKASALIAAYQKDDGMQRAAAKVLSRQLTPTGKLPVTVNTIFVNGSGIGASKQAL